MGNNYFAIIQARLGSKRFPRKMLSRIGDYSLIEWVLKRIKKCKNLDGIILATSNLKDDMNLFEIAIQEGLLAYRGSETNVYDRFIKASEYYKVDKIIRICGDNPFVDPYEIDKLVDFYKKNEYDYVCNHMNKLNNLYADGFGAEILSKKILKSFEKDNLTPSHREHVTSYIWDNQKKYRIHAIKAPKSLAYPEYSFDINDKKDLNYINDLVLNGVELFSKAEEIMRIASSVK